MGLELAFIFARTAGSMLTLRGADGVMAGLFSAPPVSFCFLILSWFALSILTAGGSFFIGAVAGFDTAVLAFGFGAVDVALA